MTLSAKDFSILDKMNLERKPVGVKFLAAKPEKIAHLSKTLNMCEMLKEAQTSQPFYATKGDWACVEPMLLGYEDPEPILVSGLFGGKEGLFQDNRACREMYNYLPYMKKGSVHSVAFASIDKMPYDPDVLVIMADVSQAQTILRSVNYSTGEPITAKFTPVCMCAWMFNYPVLSGEINFNVTGLGLGMQALQIFPPGIFIISVPWVKIPTMLNNLKDMGVGSAPRKAKTPAPATGTIGDAHRKRVNKMMVDLRKEIKN
jgi:uncharacterized protein (DUF169 family)